MDVNVIEMYTIPAPVCWKYQKRVSMNVYINKNLQAQNPQDTGQAKKQPDRKQTISLIWGKHNPLKIILPSRRTDINN